MEKEESNVSNNEQTPNDIQGSESVHVLNNEVSTFKVIASQLLAILPIICFQFRIGMELGFTAVLISEIFKKNSEINITLGTLTWFSSYCFIIPMAAIFGGVVAQYAGVRKLLIFSYLFYILADLIFHWANNVAMILAAQVIVGFTKGMSKMPSYTYTAEIVQPKYRSIFMAIINLSAISGLFLSTLLGNVLHWRTQALVSLICPIFGFAFIRFIPNSPYWLASTTELQLFFTYILLDQITKSRLLLDKKRFDEAEQSLASVRGWTTPQAVRTELYSSISNAPISLEASQEESDLKLRKQKNLKKTSLYFDKSFYIPLLTMICVFFFASWNGASSLLPFSGLLFDKIKSPITGHVASLMFSASILVGVFVYILTIRFLGIRILTLVSEFMFAVSFILAAMFLHDFNNQSTDEIYTWIVPIFLTISVFAHQTGIGKIMYFLNSELYPQKLRYVGGGIGHFTFEIMAATADKTFLYFIEALTFPGALMLFAIVNIIGFSVIYFILPETEGVSLTQIEAHYTGTRKLKNRC